MSDYRELNLDGALGADIRMMVRKQSDYVSCYIAGLYNEVTCPYILRTDAEHITCSRVAALLRKWRKRYHLPIAESDYSGRWRTV